MIKKTLTDLRAIHDRSVVVPNRIRACIAALVASGNEWAYEGDFMSLVKPPISGTDISKYREQFTDFWADMPAMNGKSHVRRAWFATKKLADKWKEEVNG
ncbi:MAG: hypothetical protein ACLQFI_18370 [Methylocella sp.]